MHNIFDYNYNNNSNWLIFSISIWFMEIVAFSLHYKPSFKSSSIYFGILFAIAQWFIFVYHEKKDKRAFKANILLDCYSAFTMLFMHKYSSLMTIVLIRRIAFLFKGFLYYLSNKKSNRTDEIFNKYNIEINKPEKNIILTMIFAMVIVSLLAIKFDKGIEKNLNEINNKMEPENLSNKSTYTTRGKVKYDKMIYINGSEFIMGSNNGDNDEKPAHKVILSSYYIDKYEVSNIEYNEYLKNNYSTSLEYINHPLYNRDEYPVVGISWFEANNYCIWKGKRLPTEAEWEFAARGNFVNKDYPWGNESPEAINYPANYLSEYDGSISTSPVYSYAPNSIGIFCISGNVSEWCSDWYDEHYYSTISNHLIKNPKGPNGLNKNDKVVRGGSFMSENEELKVYHRDHFSPSSKEVRLGFRCAKDE